MFDIKVTTTKLTAINNSLAYFKCSQSVGGFFHVSDNGNTTVVLDGGYVLGKFCCPLHAVKAAHNTTDLIEDADKNFGMTYENYKSVFLSGKNARTH
ncbi:DNA breaking-rejoining protein [Mangrovibacter phragmitis]|uniref:DNA breaking-rejoining protein n=1 Tax=Mangrovibacter phragmitis TaxID=1691903 RepID=UPI003518936A